MASHRLRTTKGGKPYYEITISRGRGKSYVTKRWYPPEGWSQKSIDRELAKVEADLEREVKEGKVVTQEGAKAAGRPESGRAGQNPNPPPIRGAGVHAHLCHPCRRKQPCQLPGSPGPVDLSRAGGDQAAGHHPHPRSPPCCWGCKARERATHGGESLHRPAGAVQNGGQGRCDCPQPHGPGGAPQSQKGRTPKGAGFLHPPAGGEHHGSPGNRNR